MPDNVRLQLEAKHILLDYGFIPFSPLENHFAEIYKHRKEGEWLEWDLEWLKVCDILVRIRSSHKDLEISSPGSDIETKFALKNSIKVFEFKNLEELKVWAKDFCSKLMFIDKK